jgi:hypothetical protein
MEWDSWNSTNSSDRLPASARPCHPRIGGQISAGSRCPCCRRCRCPRRPAPSAVLLESANPGVSVPLRSAGGSLEGSSRATRQTSIGTRLGVSRRRATRASRAVEAFHTGTLASRGWAARRAAVGAKVASLSASRGSGRSVESGLAQCERRRARVCAGSRSLVRAVAV